MGSSVASPKQASRIVLVPNRDILQRQVAERLLLSDDHAVQVAPPIFIFSDWVEELAVRSRQLLGERVPGTQDPLQALLAWTRARSGTAGSLGRAFDRSAATQARAADRYLRQWLIDEDTPWLEDGFFRQRQAVRRAMESSRQFLAEDWLADLARRLDTDEDLPVALPEHIRFSGFVEFTILERRLHEALERRGVELQFDEAARVSSTVNVAEFPRPEDEWQAAALWAHQKLAQGARSVCVAMPQSVAASGPESRRIRQIFATIFRPTQAAMLDGDNMAGYHIPAAGRLSHTPAICDALCLITLSASGMDRAVEFPVISQWLLSAHWLGSEAEGAARARLEAWLGDRGLFRLSPRAVLRLAQSINLDEALGQLSECVTAGAAPFTPTRAGQWMHDQLLRWGWPGDARGSAVNDVMGQLKKRLERMDGLTFDSANEAIALLEARCSESTVPCGGGPLSPVQLLTPEVAAGGRFDALWACQVDDANWPPPIVVNPYLPAAARAAIPRLNPEGQLEYYRRLTAMLCAAAPEVCLSWSNQAGEGPRRPSGLIAGFATEKPTPQASMMLSRAIWPAAGEGDPPLAAIDDDHGVAFPAEGTVDLPGGAGFFRLQAACPLAAYLRYRLKAEFADMPSALGSPLFRGELLHQALCKLYEDAQREGRMPQEGEIGRAVDVALSQLRAREQLTAAALLAESQRLRRLMAEWLALDRSRGGFRVDGLEQALEGRVGRAALRVRIDRVDRLSDGRFFLIDYKSGKSGTSRALKWGRPRLQEPQLPLYAELLAADGRDAGGLAFAIVKPGQCGFDGMSDDQGSATNGIRVFGADKTPAPFPDWPALRAHWHEQLAILRDEILSGLAVNCVHDADPLSYGELQLILRHDQAG